MGLLNPRSGHTPLRLRALPGLSPPSEPCPSSPGTAQTPRHTARPVPTLRSHTGLPALAWPAPAPGPLHGLSPLTRLLLLREPRGCSLPLLHASHPPLRGPPSPVSEIAAALPPSPSHCSRFSFPQAPLPHRPDNLLLTVLTVYGLSAREQKLRGPTISSAERALPKSRCPVSGRERMNDPQ